MFTIKRNLIFLTSLLTSAFSFYVVGNLMLFLSTPKSTSEVNTWDFDSMDGKSRLEAGLGPLAKDTIYVVLFIMQHSLMKLDFVKNLYKMMNLVTAERSIYCLISSVCLQYMLKNWTPADSLELWYVDVENSAFLWWIFVIVHAMAWIIICGGSCLMDLSDMLGIKQAYYDVIDLKQPNTIFNSRMRHPSFIGISVLVWVTNRMTIDRLMLSLMFTTYMYIAWSTTNSDALYQKYQIKRKVQRLRRAQHSVLNKY